MISNLYFEKKFIETCYQNQKLSPAPDTKNLMICVSSSSKNFSTLITDKVTDLGFVGTTQYFPFYYYTSETDFSKGYIDTNKSVIKHEAISDYILNKDRYILLCL